MRVVTTVLRAASTIFASAPASNKCAHRCRWFPPG
jgi:hypothetical protein